MTDRRAGLSQLQVGSISQAVCEVQHSPLGTAQQLAALGTGGESVIVELLSLPPAASAEVCRSSSAQTTSVEHGSVPADIAETRGQMMAEHSADTDSNGADSRQQPRVPQPSDVRSNLAPTLCTIEGAHSGRRWAVHPVAPHTLGDLLRQPAAAEADLLRDNAGRLLLFQLLSGVAELHADGRWHGCLTPEHVLLTRDRCGVLAETCCGPHKQYRLSSVLVAWQLLTRTASAGGSGSVAASPSAHCQRSRAEVCRH